MPRRLKVIDINPHVVCPICEGYLVDATAIIECLHAFCRMCIVRYLENSKFCPVCDVQVHKTKPLLSIRSDQTLQDVVYKMVPELYQNEMQRRREFYAEHPDAALGLNPEERGEGELRFFSPKETISLSLHHVKCKEAKSAEQPEMKDPTTRHLNCPAAFTVGHLKKFIHLKFSLPHACKVDVFYDGHLLKDSFTLMDVAYIYSWKRAEPMKFLYTIAKRVPKYVEPPPPRPEAILPAAAEARHFEECTADDVPEVLTVSAKPEYMEVESEASKPETKEVNNAPLEEAIVSTSELFPTSSNVDAQVMDVTEREVQCNSSLPVKSNLAPLVPEPTYNSVKVVSTPEPNTLLSPTNGFRLKFIHDPELNPKKSSSKKSGRKGGRSSRHKSAPVRLARLAPYPPPPPPVTCLTTPQHLSQLTVGKLVPSVIPTLAPSFVTTLVSTTSNSLCSNVTNNASSASTFLGQSPAVCTITTPSALLPSTPVLPSATESTVTLSSTANTVAVSACPVGGTTNSLSHESSIVTKELSNAEAISSICISVPSSAHTSTSVTVPSDSDIPMLNSPPNSSACDTSSLTNSIDSQLVHMHVPDSSLSLSPKSSTEVSSSTKDIDGFEIVTSTSADPLVSVLAAVPIPHPDSDARDAFRETSDVVRLSSELASHSCNSIDKQELKSPVTSHCSAISHEEKNVPSSAVITSISGVSDKDGLPPKEFLVGKTSLELINSNSALEIINNTSTKVSVTDKRSPESFCLINGDKDKSGLSTKESTHNKISSESFNPIHNNGNFKESVDSSKRSSLGVTVKSTLSAEYSDNDDLGCQPDLVVDEQKAEESSENEDDETDAALRKKINAIAEKEDETDDTEADSGRASDMSCPARCEDDVDSPAATDQVPTTTTAVVVSHQHHAKSNNIDHVIKQLYLQHEIGKSPASPKPVAATSQQQLPQRDDMGVLDLSTCTRKPGDPPVHGTRPRAVANPVLDIKHRQQTYLPAPVRQHTACVPAPKHPTSSPLLMHQLTAHPSILQAQLTGKSSHSHHHHAVPYTPYPLPSSNNRAVSSPSPLTGRPSPPSYSYRFAHQNAAALQQHGGSVNLLAGMLPYASVINSMAGFAARAGVPIPPRPSSTTSSPPTSSSNKMSSSSTSFTSHIARHAERKNWSPTPSRKLSDALLAGGPNCRGPSALPTSPTGVPAHPRASPSLLRMSPHHKSASPAPSPQNVSSSSMSMTTSTAAMTTNSNLSQNKQSVPIYKKSDSFKGYNKFKRSANLAVFNPDPNGYRQKLVIKNLDSRSNSNSNHHHHHH